MPVATFHAVEPWPWGAPVVVKYSAITSARDSGRRPPFRLLPALLRFGTSHPEQRALLKDVLGPRGAWLAGHHPPWHWATPPREVARRFATGSRAERLALLGELRATDPAAARVLVEDTWSSEPAATRAALLDTLHIGLTGEDEPLLERALDDRAASVRAAAAVLLDSLPDSARGKRMAGRARALWQGNATFDLPGEPGEAARRDGITDTREPGQGRATSWLIQLLTAAPLSTWDTHAIGEADKAVLTGWTRAALRQRNQRWLVALARHQPTPELVAALTPDAAAEVLTREQKVDTRFGHLLAAAAGPWPARFSADLVDRLQAAKKDEVLRLASGALAEHLHPATLGRVEAWLTGLPTTRKVAHRALRGVVHALTIRATILQEFS